MVQGQVSSKKNIVNELKDLKNLFDSGSLTKDQYEKAKKVIKLITFKYGSFSYHSCLQQLIYS